MLEPGYANEETVVHERKDNYFDSPQKYGILIRFSFAL
jgi:hypothetical protein